MTLPRYIKHIGGSAANGVDSSVVGGTARLTFAQREKARQRVTLEDGSEIALQLPRGTVIRGGDHVLTEQGERVVIEAAPEAVSTVHSTAKLVAIAYHLGNRHVRLQVGPDWVRYLRDHVLDDMVLGLGGELSHEDAPFEPEVGAYGHGHHHA